MISVKFTRTQILDLMKELPEHYWMQIRLLNALQKYDLMNNYDENNRQKSSETIEYVNRITIQDDDIRDVVRNKADKTPAAEKKLTADDIELHNSYNNPYENKSYVEDEKTLCDFVIAWVGECKKPSVKGAHQCFEHYNLKCSMCDKVAITECDATYGLVCGAPLCDKHQNKHHNN